MVRHLGFHSLFIFQPAAENKWSELLQRLGQLLDNVTYTSEENSAMNYNTIFRMVKRDLVSVVCYFDHKFQQFLHQVVKAHTIQFTK